MKKNILMLYQYDDVDAKSLYSKICQLYNCKIFEFGHPEGQYNVHLDKNNFFIEHNGITLTKNDFINSSLIYFRLWRMDIVDAVNSTLTKADSACFSMREWFSTLQSILFIAESCTEKKKWLNPPSVELKSRSKPYLLYRANQHLNLSNFLISTNIKKSKLSPPLVAKCISTNQKYTNNMYFRTTLLDNKLLANLPTVQTTPAFFSEYIKSSNELRVYFFLGDIFAVKLSSKKHYIDIRNLKKNELIAEITDLPSEVKKSINDFCDSEELLYCCFDFLVTDKKITLIDITPNGTWDFYDSLIESKILERFSFAISRFLM